MAPEQAKILIVFGNNLRQLRKDKQLTLLDLEVSSGVNQGDISRIENGKKNLSFTTLYKLAKGLDMHPSQLLLISFP
ncbi:XRE family transcriptional regulator [Chitinophaga silvisoli]|uniref:XRE family transcriptional regulator n=2 Tax=Chitinophaga silvisoli TaxID=2291814 RepID=A0A3E1P2S9_9BACT|nr:XRE family transcriptional regulator [Chitinophaga silvisoli]